jgi:hypothetical protein
MYKAFCPLCNFDVHVGECWVEFICDNIKRTVVACGNAISMGKNAQKRFSVRGWHLTGYRMWE